MSFQAYWQKNDEHQVRNNAAFRLFCGYGILTNWHVPDHTKTRELRPKNDGIVAQLANKTQTGWHLTDLAQAR